MLFPMLFPARNHESLRGKTHIMEISDNTAPVGKMTCKRRDDAIDGTGVQREIHRQFKIFKNGEFKDVVADMINVCNFKACT